uniref:Uncharacterized protein n=1 Tax=viral metagenome TaxID=1070528 RepID=A0A6C0HQQ9_9ZZZZ
MDCIDSEWESFVGGKTNDTEQRFTTISESMPMPSNIYISTKSKLGYLNTEFNIKETFWKIPILPYWRPSEGIVKKQIKFVSCNLEELTEIQNKLATYECSDQQIITHINNPTGRIQFKDIRKLSIGVSKKDILSCHSKKKGAFYNCFVLNIRIKWGGVFREVHVKIFNTGKIEIPGIQSDEMYDYVLKKLLELFREYCNLPDIAHGTTSETILINSNFSIGFYVDRERLYSILREKYNIECVYDPCSYPGIQCKYYFSKCHTDCEDIEIIKQMTGVHLGENLVSVSFMIFRTGSVLIVGKCSEKILNHIYLFLLGIFKTEYFNIAHSNIEIVKEKSKKLRKKTIYVN